MYSASMRYIASNLFLSLCQKNSLSVKRNQSLCQKASFCLIESLTIIGKWSLTPPL